jgi:fructose-specific phosphotransferase system IIC component
MGRVVNGASRYLFLPLLKSILPKFLFITKNKPFIISDDHEEVLQLLINQNEILNAMLIEQRRTNEILASLFAAPLKEE